MLLMGYEFEHHSICADGDSLGSDHGRHFDWRQQLRAAKVKPDRRQQFKPEIRELARGHGPYRRGFDLSDLSPNSEVAAAQPTGSTGHWPVPSGDPPLGTGRESELFRAAVFNVSRLPLPSGQ